MSHPNRAWVTDITYIRTWQGWLYLAVVMDLFSRRIVGWSAGPTIHRELVLDALLMAVRRRRPLLMAVRRRRPRRTVIHSDQGTQYGSDAWRRFCRSHRLVPSMSRRGNCWDNAVAEAFFSSLKKERIKKRILPNARARGERRGRLHRHVLQSDTASQSSRGRESRAVRSSSERAKRSPLNPGNSNCAATYAEVP
jgi:transposase InsO family protein